MQSPASTWISLGKNDNYHCICWIEVNDETAVYITKGMKQLHFRHADISELLSYWRFSLYMKNLIYTIRE